IPHHRLKGPARPPQQPLVFGGRYNRRQFQPVAVDGSRSIWRPAQTLASLPCADQYIAANRRRQSAYPHTHTRYPSPPSTLTSFRTISLTSKADWSDARALSYDGFVGEFRQGPGCTVHREKIALCRG